jgi:hypothetical protein
MNLLIHILKGVVTRIGDSVGDVNCHSGLHWWTKYDNGVFCSNCGISHNPIASKERFNWSNMETLTTDGH